MFSLFTKASVPTTPQDRGFATSPIDPYHNLKRTATVSTVASGIKAEQERSDILQEQIVLLSEKAAQAYDKVAEHEAENKRLLENIKNLESLLQEKTTINKRKTTNQELLDLKIQNNSLSDKIHGQTNEIAKLRKENTSLKSTNNDLQIKSNDLESRNTRYLSKNRALNEECDKLTQQLNIMKSTTAEKSTEPLESLSHERDNSISSVSSKSSTMFSYTYNSSTDEVNRQAFSPLNGASHDMVAELSKKLSAYKRENQNLQEKLAVEKQKRATLVANFRDYEKKNAMLSDFNKNYIQQLNQRIEEMKINEERLQSRIDLIHKNISLIRTNQKPLYQ
ncbi:hypothetical protein DASC09_049770 [Saccharomycopsis crataegensis]|uniref:Uncharacterized protein n=1 Tax=Saccharomycopsis crataegensis TaxID=43959 RepID=A0AAV5QST8_9ASCO|nr:hypothetical protein DASC09_049770 [Saccharomycopsis crataegensis]